MNRNTYYRGTAGKKYGIWNCAKKCFQFGICEDTPMLAQARLYQKIGDDARKYRFEPRMLPSQPKNRNSIISVETNMYDQEEIYENCTVQVLTNTATGAVSVGWWRNNSTV